MSVFIDQNYRCHIQNDGTMREVKNKFFDGKCKTFVEGYRYIPDGETWVSWDGFKFRGEMICPYKPYDGIAEAQSSYTDGRDKVINAIGEAVSGRSEGFTAEQNYAAGSLLMINGEAYETIKAIPRGKIIHINEDVIKTTITKFMEENANE